MPGPSSQPCGSNPVSGFDTKKSGVRDIPERLLGWVATLAGAALFGIMVLVTVSVLFRYVLHAPILGSQEMVQLGMVFVIMLAMPYTALRGQHIRVDIFDHYLGRTGRFACDAVARLAGMAVLFLLARKSVAKAIDAWKYEDVTNMIELPLWTAYAAVAAGMGLFMIVLALQLWRQIKAGASYDD